MCVFFQYIFICLVFFLVYYFVLAFSVLSKRGIIYSLELHWSFRTFSPAIVSDKRGGGIIAPNLGILAKDRSNKSEGERLRCRTYDSFGMDSLGTRL